MTLPGISLPDDRYRRAVGFVLGAVVGLTYAAVYQFGDQIVLPGVPLYRPPFGLEGNLLAFALGGGLLGLVASWPRSGLAGTFTAAGISAVLLVAGSLLGGNAGERQSFGANLIVGIFVALPFWGLLIPFIGALTWVVHREEEARRDRQAWYRRAWQPLLLVLIAGLAGFTALYRADARVLIARTDELLQQAQGGGPLPGPLAATSITTRGQGPYELSWERERIERYRIPRPGKNFDQHSVVVARFANGWNLVCLYVDMTDPPLCQDMEVIPR